MNQTHFGGWAPLGPGGEHTAFPRPLAALKEKQKLSPKVYYGSRTVDELGSDFDLAASVSDYRNVILAQWSIRKRSEKM